METVTQPAGNRLDAWARKLDERPALILGFLAVVYLIRLQLPMRLLLWFDELHTYYIAQAPTLARFIEEVRLLDLNPPLIYVFARVSYDMFGVTSFAVRLPSVIAFFLASAAVFTFLSRKMGATWAAAAIALFWYSPYFRYATEARPYGILLAFFSLTLLSWDSLNRDGRSRKRALAGIAAGNTGMMLSHAFAPFSILPFCVAELVRSWRLRRIDWAMWAALLLPLACALIYIPLLHQAGAATQPPLFRASFEKILLFYGGTFILIVPGLLAALAAAFGIAWWRRATREPVQLPGWATTTFGLTLLAAPVLVNLIVMRGHGPFWDRYCITSAFAFYAVIVWFFAHESRGNRLAGLAAALTLITISVTQDLRDMVLQAQPIPPARTAIEDVRPELPLVTNSAATFLEMDYHQNSAFLERVYYLTDRPSALRYARTDLFEGMPVLKQYFPIRANIAPYESFTREHRSFLVLGVIDHPEDWLLRKLIAEGATVTQIDKFTLPYPDSTLYSVTLPGSK